MQDSEFEYLKAIALSRKRLKTNLVEHQALIKKMLDSDISLPVIFEWLREKEIGMALTTLRRFVKKTYGEDFYAEYAKRNGWIKNKQHASSVRMDGKTSHSALVTKLQETRKETAHTLGNPGDINNFFNSRKS